MIDRQKLKEALDIPDDVSIVLLSTSSGFHIKVNPNHGLTTRQIDQCLIYWSSRIVLKKNILCLKCKTMVPVKHIHWHHIVFRSAGGGDEPDNLAPLCFHCHVGDNAIHDLKWNILDVISKEKYGELKDRYA